MTAQVGKPAPDFETSAHIDGGFKDIKLSDYRGRWVVLFFYPGDFTFVCPTELAAAALRYDEIKGLGAEILAMSTDSRFTHKIWQEEELSKMVEGGVPFPMLSDQTGAIGKLFGVYDEESGVDIRGTFLVDPDGVVQASEIVSPLVGRDISELIRTITAFQHVRKTGKATPAGWRPGRTDLQPGPALAGNVWKVWKPEEAF
jgi:peroxiredoxin (alkyl hydroperoxide reductase subunit C)